MINVTYQISQVRRQVGTRTMAAGEARTVTVSQVYNAEVGEVWDACTNPERIPRWFMPITGDLRPGGRYQLQGNASGTIERCDPPKSFAATWEYGGEVSWIEVRISAAPEGGTRLELEHIAQVDDERWAQFGPGAVGVGWDSGLLGLAQHLSSGGGISPEQGAAWAASEEGKQFMAASSEGWREANVAAGADPAAAAQAAARTTAAYTGTAPQPANGS